VQFGSGLGRPGLRVPPGGRLAAPGLRRLVGIVRFGGRQLVVFAATVGLVLRGKKMLLFVTFG
jgi:hypothetical protein